MEKGGEWIWRCKENISKTDILAGSKFSKGEDEKLILNMDRSRSGKKI